MVLPDTYLARLRVLADDLNVGEEELLMLLAPAAVADALREHANWAGMCLAPLAERLHTKVAEIRLREQ